MNDLWEKPCLQWVRFISSFLQNISDLADIELFGYGVCGYYLDKSFISASKISIFKNIYLRLM